VSHHISNAVYLCVIYRALGGLKNDVTLIKKSKPQGRNLETCSRGNNTRRMRKREVEENNNNKKMNLTRYRMICVTDKCVVKRRDVSVDGSFVRLLLVQ
jgi:hypothetical protein